MLPLVLYARNEHPGVLIFCPHCKMGVRHDTGDISNAIHDGIEIVCVACNEPFKIVVMSLTRAAELKRAADYL
jgi:hypothetical protein